MDDLLDLGVAVLPVMDEASRSWWEGTFWNAMDEFPEYRIRGRNVQRVLGGFGALGNPSSFHHPTVRHFRDKLKRLTIAPLMKQFTSRVFGEDVVIHLEALFDRVCVRYEEFRRPTAEAWHRDIYDAAQYGLRPLPHSLPGNTEDLLFGGWSNFDHRPQSFVALVGTHKDPVQEGGGFATFSKEDIRKHRFDERLREQANKTLGSTIVTDANGHTIVPPGHCVVFFQRIVHSVKSGPQPDTPALRIFHGYRLTTETIPLMDHRVAIDHGGVPRIPSGQMPPMYSANHYAAFVSADDRWRNWAAATFQPQCLYERTSGGYSYHTPGSIDNREPWINKNRCMPSLVQMGLWNDAFLYSPRDVQVMTPERL